MNGDTEATRARLIEVETRMRALEPTSDEYWALKPERNALRDGIDILWLEEHGYGARYGRWASLPWPDDVRGRWRVLREYVEVFNVFRDVAAWEVVNRRYYSIIQQAEGDYHWVLSLDQAADEDPPIYGLILDYGTNVFGFNREPLDDSAYGSWPRLTDFARILIDVYQSTPIGCPTQRLEEVQPTTSNTIVGRSGSEAYRAASGRGSRPRQ